MGIITCALSNMKNYKADKKYFIVRSPGRVNFSQYNLVHFPALSPSMNLFLWTRRNQLKSGWFEEYRERFELEMKTDKGMMSALDQIEAEAKDKIVLLVCFCKDVNECHRGLIANEMAQRGIPVERH